MANFFRCLAVLMFCFSGGLFADRAFSFDNRSLNNSQGEITEDQTKSVLDKVVKQISMQWDTAQIPTAAVSLIYGKSQYTSRLGDAEAGGFELASSSKAFTGLLIALLELDGLMSVEDKITRWIPELASSNEQHYEKVQVKHLLSHTSGIGTVTLDLLKPYRKRQALDKLPQLLRDKALAYPVGSEGEYATINYSLLGLIAERVTGERFTNLVEKRILTPIGMTDSYALSFEHLERGSRIVTGHKISFGWARAYDEPNYLHNVPAGYVVSTPADMRSWLQFWLSAKTNDHSLAAESLRLARERILNSAVTDLSGDYFYGWEVSRDETISFSHPGQNPNATAFVAFNLPSNLGVAIMGNSNSPATIDIGVDMFENLRDTPLQDFELNTSYDLADIAASLIAISLIISTLLLILLMCYRGSHRSLHPQLQKIILQTSLISSESSVKWPNFAIQLFVQNVVLLCLLWYLPLLLVGVGWENLLVWGGLAFPALACSVIVFLNVANVSFFFAAKYRHSYNSQFFAKIVVCKIIGLTVISGLINSIIVLLITETIKQSGVVIFYSGLVLLCCVFFYILTRRSAEIQAACFGHIYVSRWRQEIIGRLLGAEYQRVERISPGKIQSIVGENAQELTNSLLIFLPMLANLLTIIFLLGYLLITQSTSATLALIICITPVIILYYRVSEKAQEIVPETLKARSEFMEITEDLQKGHKSLQRQRVKRRFYQHVTEVVERFKRLRINYEKKFLNAYFTGETILILILIAVVVVFPLGLESFDRLQLAEYLIILLYLIGPINVVMDSMPDVIKLKSLISNMAEFSESIAGNKDPQSNPVEKASNVNSVNSIELNDVTFSYIQDRYDDETFGIGPINLVALRGKSYFLTGGNGSGKSTLALILAGLYVPSAGAVRVNGQIANPSQLVEYVTTVFSDNWLFKRIYDPLLMDSIVQIKQYIERLGLADKVSLNQTGDFSTIKISTGQRKRLSLAVLLTDPSPIVVLDEWAADQDPVAKRRFYREWIPELKAQGKIVFVVTHDDEYYAEADALLAMKNGQLKLIEQCFT